MYVHSDNTRKIDRCPRLKYLQVPISTRKRCAAETNMFTYTQLFTQKLYFDKLKLPRLKTFIASWD